MYVGVARQRIAAPRHMPRNHTSRGSFTTSSQVPGIVSVGVSASANWPSSQS